MDCRTVRAAFSEYLDQRVPAELRGGIDGHLVGCSSCRDTWRAYQRLFLAVTQCATEPAQRPFVLPEGPPGGGRVLPLAPTPWWRWRNRVAAAVAVGLIAITAYELGQDSGRSHDAFGSPRIGIPPARQAAVVADASDPQARFRTVLSDHVDAAQLVTRQMAYTPDGAGDATREVIRAQMAMLKPERLQAALDSAGCDGCLQRAAQDYVAGWEAFSKEVEPVLAFTAGPDFGRRLRRRPFETPVCDTIAPFQALLATVPRGQTWADPDVEAALLDDRERAAHPADVKSYLIAVGGLLAGRPVESASHFNGLIRDFPGSELGTHARYLQAEALQRAGFHSLYTQALCRLAPPERVLPFDPTGCFLQILQHPGGAASLRFQGQVWEDSPMGTRAWYVAVPDAGVNWSLQIRSTR